MPQINYTTARQMLNQACERYISHKNYQLSKLTTEAPITPPTFFYLRALGDEEPGSGFQDWMSCIYAYLFDQIGEFNKVENYRCSGSDYYERNYPASRGKTSFYCEHSFYGAPAASVNHPRLLDRVSLLIGLMHFIMINENKEQDFEQRWEDYQKENGDNYICLENDPDSVKIYKELMRFKSLISFINTLPEYYSDSLFLLRHLNQALPTIESYCKCLAVQELKEILNDTALSDEEAVNAVTLQLKNPVIETLLKKNHQSDTEHMLKMLAVVLVIALIGVIPTVCLAAKRLYNTGGSSINFFKPLSTNLCEDIESVATKLPLSNS